MTKSDIQKIAKLARLELTEEELDKYAEQLSQILGYIDQLNEVQTEGVEITSQVTGLVNIFREDKVEECRVVDALLEQAPEVADKGVKVKSVF